MVEQLINNNMEDIKKKAQDNELNIEKGEDLSRQPRKFIPVPKVNKDKNDKENGKSKR